jgi:hypothetical protein
MAGIAEGTLVHPRDHFIQGIINGGVMSVGLDDFPTSTNRNSFQQGLESGSGSGALPGAPRATPLDSATENLRVLNAVET